MTDAWEKVRTNACGRGTYVNPEGWVIEHCGHPTANYPYAVYAPDGSMRLAANGRAHQNLKAAKAAVEQFMSEEK